MRVPQRISRLERRSLEADVCAVCAGSGRHRVLYEIDGVRAPGSEPCPACRDRAAIIVSFISAPHPDGSAPPPSSDTSWLQRLASV